MFNFFKKTETEIQEKGEDYEVISKDEIPSEVIDFVKYEIDIRNALGNITSVNSIKKILKDSQYKDYIDQTDNILNIISNKPKIDMFQEYDYMSFINMTHDYY
jgi:hypothetical protein